MKFLLTLWLCKIISAVIKLIDKHRGSNYSGSIAISLMPDFIAHFKGIDCEKVLFITGTNGKSTTTNLLNHTLQSAGFTTACNIEGANLLSGAATTLIKNTTLSGRFKRDYLVLEVDERTLPTLSKYLPACHLGVTNLQKDQVQRNGDPDFVFRKIAGCITPRLNLYLNNEEPRSRALDQYGGHVIYYGVAENEKSNWREDDYSVTLPCPKCGHPIRYQRYNLCSIGPFSCTHCDHHSVSRPEVWIENVDYAAKTFACSGVVYTVDHMNPFYLYNYAMVIGICRALQISDAKIQKAFEDFVNPAAHDYVIDFHGKEVRCLSCKQENPEAMQSLLDIIASDPREKALFIGMYEIEDFQPFFAGSFYSFDCDFAPLMQSNICEIVSFSRTVCHDVALRLIYAGADASDITIMDTNDFPQVADQIDACKSKLVYVLSESDHYQKDIYPYFQQHGGHLHEGA